PHISNDLLIRCLTQCSSVCTNSSLVFKHHFMYGFITIAFEILLVDLTKFPFLRSRLSGSFTSYFLLGLSIPLFVLLIGLLLNELLSY
ncbi:MAG: hypothetical protein ACKO7B_07510, partial [Flavobacteriales bacterium]